MAIPTPVFYGFEETENVTFLKYTTTPIRRLRYNFTKPRVMSEEQYNAIDWSTRPIAAMPRLTSVATIPFDDICDVKAKLAPAAQLDLSVMAANGLLPAIFKHSHPDVDADSGYLTIDPIEVTSIAGIHDAIYRTILPNLHYCQRVRDFINKWGILQQHPDGEVDMVPNMTDEAAEALLAVEKARACHRMWYRSPIFLDEEQDRKLGLASWLWADINIVQRQRAGERFEATGSVLFTYIPYWMMPEKELEALSALEDLDDPARPDWFAGIHASCQETGAHHLVIYTGDCVVIGVFNATFDGVLFSDTYRVDVRRSGGYGYGMDHKSGLEHTPPERMEICLVQLVTQVMTDAKASQIIAVVPNATAGASTSAAPMAALPFPVAPLARNDNRPAQHGTVAQIQQSMRFSRRVTIAAPYPSQKEIQQQIRQAARVAQQDAVASSSKAEPAVQLASEEPSEPVASGSGSRKRARDDESTLPTPPRSNSPLPVPHAPPRSTRSTRTAPTRGAASRPSKRRAVVDATRSMDELSRPAKRTRTTAPAPPAVPVAGPSSAPRQSARQAAARDAKNGNTHAERKVKLAEVSDSKKRRDIKTKAQGKGKGKDLKIAIPGPSKRTAMIVIKVEEVDEEEQDEASVEDMMDVDEPESRPVVVVAAAAVPPKTKAVVKKSSVVTRQKKMEAAAESSKKATVKSKTKVAAATAVKKARSDGALTTGDVRYVLRTRSIPVLSKAGVSEVDEAVVGKGRAPLRRSARK
ncbi:hypothetical protein FRB96_004417 [Tulasnella sp. 330]|nr:hypothetical protein FRB96_004417 [Tulasnella sp. 330]KAG8884514.1 hypothetical protein FRB97_004027 [Tulasnella sp. 331]